MCKFIRKSNEQILCSLSKSEMLRLHSIVHVAMETTITSHFTHQTLLSVYFSLVKFQFASCNLSLAMIWQMIYTHKLPKLCSATLRSPEFGIPDKGSANLFVFFISVSSLIVIVSNCLATGVV